MKKIVFLFSSLLVCLQLIANDIPTIQNILGRCTQSLNGEWHYIIDPQQCGYFDYRHMPMKNTFGLDAKAKSLSDLVEYNFDASPKMRIPSDWNTADKQLFFYEGTVWFERKFYFEPGKAQRTLLYFGAVNYEAIVYINGKQVGKHIGGFSPFNYDVTNLLHRGENSIVVMVNNERRENNIPTLIFDWWNYGGITRDVKLVCLPDNYIEDYTIELDRNNNKIINIYIKNRLKKAGERMTLSIPELKVKEKFITDSDGTVRAKINAHPIFWSPDNPKLYKVAIKSDKDSITDEIGFRTITTHGEKILLNGKPIFLRGISLHEERAYTAGRCNCIADADTLLSWAKQLGCNYVRLAHYPHNEYAVREAERMGIMIWSEIPCYWTINWLNKSTFQNASQQLHDMISRDKNRAAVIIWSIANETPHSEARDNFLSNLAKQARNLDSTRLVSMAMEVTKADKFVNRLNDNMNKFVDVISFNQYIGWYRNIGDASKMTWNIPYDKPIIISEMGGGAVAGLHGSDTERWTEEFQAKLYLENFNMIDKIKGLAGTSPWILKDFLSPRRTLYGIQNWYNRKGLVSDQGVKKKAFYIVKEWYARKSKEYGK